MLLSLIKIFMLCSNLTHFAIKFVTHFIIEYYCPFLKIRNKEIRKFASFCDLMRSPICSELDSFKSKLSKMRKAGKYAKFMKYELWNVTMTNRDMTNRDSARDPTNTRDPRTSVFLWILRCCPEKIFLQNTSKWLLLDCVVKARDRKVIWVFFTISCSN